MKQMFGKRPGLSFFITLGVFIGILLVLGGHKAMQYTSSDAFCQKCHVHPHAEVSWKLSTHYSNDRGIVVHCTECHLPPSGWPYLREKVKTGARDVYGVIFKDTDKINWEEKRLVENAVHHVYKESCISCHQNLFPLGLSQEGDQAHLYYSSNPDKLHCINCHLHVGHHDENAIKGAHTGFVTQASVPTVMYTEAAKVDSFQDFTEFIPGTGVSFELVAIPGGRFLMGSSAKEPYRRSDEGPVREVEVSPFFMGRVEVTWDEYMAFFAATASEGRLDPFKVLELNRLANSADAISGPTPPYGYPDQGWGLGKQPAITMSHTAAELYCQWLSLLTGKKYRLPTEAEWEYAARGGTQDAYFFEGNPRKFSSDRFWNKLFGPDTSVINTYVIYNQNSWARAQMPGTVKPNPFGLVNMLGNVREFCSDWYAPNTYSQPDLTVKDPKGPESGEEKVVRGGSFRSDASEVRVARRDFTRSTDWLRTDPQVPKSIWWYSDVIDVGFRVVCEF